MKAIAQIISTVFHPLFLNFYLLMLVYPINPFAFQQSLSRDINLFRILTFVTVVLFPLVAVMMMRGLKMIKSIHLHEREDRIGPMIATMIFYIWYFINIYQNTAYPRALAFVALGSAIALVMAFFVNNFSKISLHTVGAGAFVAACLLLAANFSMDVISVSFATIGSYEVSIIFVVLVSLFVAGLVGSARLILRAHREIDIYGGYLVGFLAQMVAFRILIDNQ